MEQDQRQITAVIYARVSSDAQDTEQKVSLDEQVEDGRRYCEAKGYHVGEIYREVGPGWSRERPELKQLIEDGRQGKFQRIVCWRLDRLARGLSPLVPILDLVDYHGVEIEGVRETLSKTMLAVVGTMGRMELDSLREQ